jgi:type I restriction enzyme S subunit
MGSWKKTKWGEVATLEYGKALRDYDEENGAYPVYGTNGQIGWNNEPLVNRPGVIIGRKGAYRGVEYSDKPFCVIDTAFYLDLTTDKVLDKWAYYQLEDFDINNIDSGTAIPSTSREAFYQIPVAIPPIEQQKKIVDTLSAFDDLIENNSRRIEILEEMARRIYREWFVHFRYPGHNNDELVDSGTDLGEIPEGWDIVEVQDVIDVNPRTSIDKEKERPYLPMADVSENSMLIDDTDLEYRDGSGGSKFKNYDTLFARITPSLENGKTGFVQFLKSDEQIAMGSTEFIVLRSKKLNPYFVYCLARDGQFRESAIKSMVGASGRQRVRIGTVKEFKITFPPKELLSKFKNITEPMFKEVGVLSEQNKKLKATRDLLLPKLISGKIDVDELHQLGNQENVGYSAIKKENS